MKIRWTASARKQLDAAVDYLEERRTGAGRQLHEAVQHRLTLASRHPFMFPMVPGSNAVALRRALIRQFSYWLIYAVRGEEIRVIAVWHEKRRPLSWPQG